MADNTYLLGRSRYSRPQAMLWSENPGFIFTETDPQTGEQLKAYIPNGYEIGSDYPETATQEEIDQFIVLSDHNRSPIDISYERIENRQRTVNGTMRSRHIADKLKISTSWDMLPSRAFASDPLFNVGTGLPVSRSTSVAFTADYGAGGNDLVDWYQNHSGPFWVFLGYDKLSGINTGETRYRNFKQYTQIAQMYISNFTYSIQKRSGSLYDMWNISVDLEEV